MPDDHLSGDEGLQDDQRDLDGLQADLQGAVTWSAMLCAQACVASVSMEVAGVRR